MPNRPSGSHSHTEVYSVTTVRASAAEDRHQREVRYLLAMGFRMICFAGALATTGWVRWSAVAVAVVMPWVAVVMANNRGTPSFARVDPGTTRGLGMTRPEGPPEGPDRPSPQEPVSGVIHLPDARHTDSGLPSGVRGKNNG